MGDLSTGMVLATPKRMDNDAAVRWGALGLIAVAGLAAYIVGDAERKAASGERQPDASETPGAETSAAQAPSGKPRLAASARPFVSSRASPVPVEEEVDDAAPRAARPRSAVPRPSRMAVDLPIVGGPASKSIEPTGTKAAPTPPGPCGGVLVRLITASHDPDWAFASIADGPGKPSRIRRVGDSVAAWRVDAIEWDRVWLRSNGTRCAAAIHDGAREARVAVGLDSTTTGPLEAAEDEAPPWQVPADLLSGIRQRSATEFVIDAKTVAKIFEQGPALLAGVQFEPVAEGSEFVGVSLDSIPAHSLLDRLGVEQGDVVVALNENPVMTLDAAIQALADARQRNQLIARLQRGGQAFDLDVGVATAQPAPGTEP